MQHVSANNNSHPQGDTGHKTVCNAQTYNSYHIKIRDQLEVQLQSATRIPPQPATPKLQHTSKQEHTSNVVIQQKSRRLLMRYVLMSETC